MIESLISSVGAAIGYTVIAYSSKVQNGESWQWRKALRTLVIGIVVGLVAYSQGISVTTANWETMLAANAGVIAVIDKVFTTVVKIV
jgi:hypothetical protein